MIEAASDITIVFAYRNRDVKRLEICFKSLALQTHKGFNVILVDYGSDEQYSAEVFRVVGKFDFVNYYYIGHDGLLWNKSKALNFGILESETDYIVTADVDLLFKENFVEALIDLKSQSSFTLFRIGYLSSEETKNQQIHLNFKTISTTHVGDTFGIGLYPKSVLTSIRGLDEFYHFYGSEDEDLNMRVQLFGATLKPCSELMLYHQWHSRYPRKIDESLTIQPRLRNILRINQRHFLQHKAHKIITVNEPSWGQPFSKEHLEVLKSPTASYQLTNVEAYVIHFFEEELPKCNKGIYKIVIEEDDYYNTIKYKLKVLFKKQTQPYLSMKAVNDVVLKAILFRYRDYNYSYVVSKDLKKITFILDFDS